MTEAAAFIVQFPHPGGEHHPATEEMPWNGRPPSSKVPRRPWAVS